jgi:hypothetical protein
MRALGECVIVIAVLAQEKQMLRWFPPLLQEGDATTVRARRRQPNRAQYEALTGRTSGVICVACANKALTNTFSWRAV